MNKKEHEYLIIWQNKEVGWFKSPDVHFIYMDGKVEFLENNKNTNSFKNIVKDYLSNGNQLDKKNKIRLELCLNGDRNEVTHGLINDLVNENELSLRRIYKREEINWIVKNIH